MLVSANIDHFQEVIEKIHFFHTSYQTPKDRSSFDIFRHSQICEDKFVLRKNNICRNTFCTALVR